MRQALETAARNLYMTRKDPGDAAALYCALGRMQVLSALYRSAGDKQMPSFLSRDFSDPKHQTAASKNAYALLGMNKHSLAVAFFLMAGAPADAASIAARRLADPQLALAIARLADAIAGNERGWGEHAQAVAAEQVLPTAVEAGDLWTQHALLWRMGRTSDAVAVLLDAIHGTRQPASALALQESSTLAQLLAHVGDSVRFRMASPLDAAACASAARVASHMASRAAHDAGLPLLGMAHLAQATAAAAAGPEASDEHVNRALDAQACMRYQHGAAVRMAAAALWHGAAYECSWSPHSWANAVHSTCDALTSATELPLRDIPPDAVLSLLSRQLRLWQRPPPAPALKTPSPPTMVHSASTTLTPPPAVTIRKSTTIQTLTSPFTGGGHHHSRTNSLLAGALRLPVAGASQLFASVSSPSPLHRSVSAPTLQRDAVLAAPIEVLRAPGELVRSVAQLCSSPSVLLAATLRKGLLVSDVRSHDSALADSLEHASGDTRSGDAAAASILCPSGWASHPQHKVLLGSHSGHPTSSAQQQAQQQALSMSASEAHVRCMAQHPYEPLLAAGSAAVGTGVSLWRCGDPPVLRHVASLPWPGHGGIAAAGPPVSALTWDVSGARMGAAFADGTAAVWHVAAAGGAPYAWLSAFPGGTTHGITCLSPTVLALCGSGGDACLVLWDTLCPPKSQRVAAFSAHQGAQGASCIARGSNSVSMVYTGGAAAGDVAAFDLRAAAQSGVAAPVWRTQAGVAPASCMSSTPWAGGDGMLFVGDRGGDMRVVEARTGRVLQSVAGVHPRAVFTPPPRIGGSAISAGVTTVLPLARGILTCGADGALKLHERENSGDDA